MGALPLGERRRRIRPTARGDRAHSQGGLWGVRGSRAGPWGDPGSPRPASPLPEGPCAGQEPRLERGAHPTRVRVPCGGVTEASTQRFEAFHPKSLPPPTDQLAAGCSPSSHKSKPPPPGGTGSSGLVPGALGAARSCRCRWQGSPEGSDRPRGAAPHPTNPNLLPGREEPPGGTDGGDGAVGGLSSSYLS